MDGRAGPIEAVIFDYGGVISTPPFSGVSAFERSQGYPEGSMLRLFLGIDGDRVVDEHAAGAWHALETGALTLASFLEGVVARGPRHLGGEGFDVGAYLEFSMVSPFGVHWEVVHFARDLCAGGYGTAILTNNVAEWSPVWRSTFPVEELFPVVIDSCEVGLRKPDPAVFVLTCERLGVTPARCAFLDDNLANVAAARDLGMAATLVGEDPRVALAELDRLLAPGARPGAVTNR